MQRTAEPSWRKAKETTRRRGAPVPLKQPKDMKLTRASFSWRRMVPRPASSGKLLATILQVARPRGNQQFLWRVPQKHWFLSCLHHNPHVLRKMGTKLASPWAFPHAGANQKGAILRQDQNVTHDAGPWLGKLCCQWLPLLSCHL